MVVMDAGTILGERYRIDHRVGEGGMGVVFRGLDLTTRKQVAI